MPRYFIAALVCFALAAGFASQVEAGDISLTTPVEITPDATKVVDYAVTFEPDRIVVQLNWESAGGAIVKQENYVISGSDYNDLATATIPPGRVGDVYLDVIKKAIRTKVKALKSLDGTVN